MIAPDFAPQASFKNTKNDLQRAALRLRNAAPEEWDNFRRCFASFTNEVIVTVTEAQASDIMTAKGSALQCRWFMRLFDECDRQSNQPTP